MSKATEIMGIIIDGAIEMRRNNPEPFKGSDEENSLFQKYMQKAFDNIENNPFSSREELSETHSRELDEIEEKTRAYFASLKTEKENVG